MTKWDGNTTENTRLPICPYCNEEFMRVSEINIHGDLMRCKCGKEFEVDVHMVITYTTRRRPKKVGRPCSESFVIGEVR
jgi:hypothetical protein